MTWHAKPSGPYGIDTTENYDNSMEILSILTSQGFTVESIAGLCANAQEESGLNPWRWQGDTFNTALGYGLLQWTPSTGYTSLPGATPNMSVSQITPGATPEDGARQIQAFYENNPAKWTTLCWRTYWDPNVYPTYYNRTRYILNTWGDGNRITLSQFATITDPYYASDCFLACFEGPGVPDYEDRHQNAKKFYERFSGIVPPDPPTPPDPPDPPDPPPTPPTPGSFNLYFFLKRQADKQNINLILK